MHSRTLGLWLLASLATGCHQPTPSMPTTASSDASARAAAASLFSGTWTGQSKVLSTGILPPCHPPAWEVGGSESVTLFVSPPLRDFTVFVEVSSPLVGGTCRLRGTVHGETLAARSLDFEDVPFSSSLPFDSCDLPFDSSAWSCAEPQDLRPDDVDLRLSLDEARGDQVSGLVTVTFGATVLVKALSLTRAIGQ